MTLGAIPQSQVQSPGKQQDPSVSLTSSPWVLKLQFPRSQALLGIPSAQSCKSLRFKPQPREAESDPASPELLSPEPCRCGLGEAALESSVSPPFPPFSSGPSASPRPAVPCSPPAPGAGSNTCPVLPGIPHCGIAAGTPALPPPPPPPRAAQSTPHLCGEGSSHLHRAHPTRRGLIPT